MSDSRGHGAKSFFVYFVMACILLAVSIGTIAGLQMSFAVEKRDLIDKMTYVDYRAVDGSMLTEGQKALLVKKMYAKIIGVHQVSNAELQMGKYKLPEFINACYKITTLLRLPDYYLMTIGVMESGFNSYCTGTIGEKSQFQLHSSTLPYVMWGLRILAVVDPKAAEYMDPQVTSIDELVDPIKAAKAQGLLAWTAMREFPEELFWMSGAHWSVDRVRPWYLSGNEPKEHYVFLDMKTMTRTDKRSPLMYYFHAKRIMSNFERGNVDIGKDWVDDYRKYRDSVKKDEQQYIDSRRMVTRLMLAEKKLELKQQEFDDGMKELTAYRGKIHALDAEFKKIYGEEAKRGNYERMYSRSAKAVEDILK
jgi:hypothetical protein